MPYSELVNQAKHTVQALMPNADGGNTTDGKDCLIYTPAGQVRSGVFLLSHSKAQEYLLRKFPTGK
jgi:hypothetical protein